MQYYFRSIVRKNKTRRYSAIIFVPTLIKKYCLWHLWHSQCCFKRTYKHGKKNGGGRDQGSIYLGALSSLFYANIPCIYLIHTTYYLKNIIKQIFQICNWRLKKTQIPLNKYFTCYHEPLVHPKHNTLTTWT